MLLHNDIRDNPGLNGPVSDHGRTYAAGIPVFVTSVSRLPGISRAGVPAGIFFKYPDGTDNNAQANETKMQYQ